MRLIKHSRFLLSPLIFEIDKEIEFTNKEIIVSTNNETEKAPIVKTGTTNETVKLINKEIINPANKYLIIP